MLDGLKMNPAFNMEYFDIYQAIHVWVLLAEEVPRCRLSFLSPTRPWHELSASFQCWIYRKGSEKTKDGSENTLELCWYVVGIIWSPVLRGLSLILREWRRLHRAFEVNPLPGLWIPHVLMIQGWTCCLNPLAVCHRNTCCVLFKACYCCSLIH